MEIWKKIDGFDYLISTLGNIKSLPKKTRKNTRYLKLQKLKTGYLSVDLCCDGSIKRFLVHRLVAKTFLENPLNKEQVNHINGIKHDNSLSNLEWATRSENQLHSISIGLRTTNGEKNSQCKLTNETVLKILEDQRKYSIISKQYSISIPTISDIKRGYSWTHITGLKNIKKLCKQKKNIS